MVQLPWENLWMDIGCTECPEMEITACNEGWMPLWNEPQKHLQFKKEKSSANSKWKVKRVKKHKWKMTDQTKSKSWTARDLILTWLHPQTSYHELLPHGISSMQLGHGTKIPQHLCHVEVPSSTRHNPSPLHPTVQAASHDVSSQY